MLEAFSIADPAIGHENFLNRFRDAGCYLVDLCGRPVDDLEPLSRREACDAGERRLAKIIREVQPEQIATLVRSIEANVKKAASRAAWDGPFLHLPYPGRWIRHRSTFTKILVPEIQQLWNNRI
jgi:hypothetical protein